MKPPLLAKLTVPLNTFATLPSTLCSLVMLPLEAPPMTRSVKPAHVVPADVKGKISVISSITLDSIQDLYEALDLTSGLAPPDFQAGPSSTPMICLKSVMVPTFPIFRRKPIALLSFFGLIGSAAYSAVGVDVCCRCEWKVNACAVVIMKEVSRRGRRFGIFK